MNNNPPSLDPTMSDWLLHTRHAGDPSRNATIRAGIEPYADRVINGARLAPGMVMADIGAGDGLVAFRAIDRIGASLRVLLTDISVPLLRHTEALAIQHDVHEQCTFLNCSAEALTGIEDASVDVVTTRAVLAYVPEQDGRIAGVPSHS